MGSLLAVTTICSRANSGSSVDVSLARAQGVEKIRLDKIRADKCLLTDEFVH